MWNETRVENSKQTRDPSYSQDFIFALWSYMFVGDGLLELIIMKEIDDLMDIY